jgi:glutamine cyclotransferase
MWDRIKAIDPEADVPNGIAYDSTTKKIYITGKLWPELYEVKFGQ